MLLVFPPCPYLRSQGSENSSMGRKHRGGAKKKAAATRNCPDCADPRYWCVAHLPEDGGLDCDEADPSAGAPGFHAYYRIPESPEQTPEQPDSQRAAEQPAHEKASRCHWAPCSCSGSATQTPPWSGC